MSARVPSRSGAHQADAALAIHAVVNVLPRVS